MNEANLINEPTKTPNKISKKGIIWIISIVLTLVIVLGAGVLKEEEKREDEQEILQTPDFSEIIKIGDPDENGIVRVYVPEVDKFEANQDSTSIKEPIYEKGVFTSITTEEKTAALAQAQEDMIAAAKTDQAMITRARENAKTIIEQYIINAGTALGQEYRVKWVDTPQEVNLEEMEGTEDGEEKE